MKKANQDPEELIQKKDNLIGVVAHDLRGPVGSIQNFIELGLEEEGEEHAEMLEIAKTQAEKCLKLINDLLDLSAVQAGRIQIKAEPIDLEAFLSRYKPHATYLAGRKDIHFTINQNLERTDISMDADRIEQVLDNLLTNAIKFSDRDTTISMEVENDDSQTLFRMKDEGCGIEEEEFSKLFEAFSQTSSQPTEGIAFHKYVDGRKAKVTLNHPIGLEKVILPYA